MPVVAIAERLRACPPLRSFFHHRRCFVPLIILVCCGSRVSRLQSWSDMGRNKKKKTKELIVGSDIEDSSSEGSGAEEAPAKKVVVKEPKKGGKKGDKHTDPAAAASAAPAKAAAAGGDDSDADEDADGGKPIGGSLKPVTVKYCPVCSFPAEYCQYSGMFEKCKPWLLSQTTAEEAAALLDAEEQGKKKKESSGPGQPTNPRKARKKEVKMLVKKRQGKKMMTIIEGLDMFGLQLSKLAAEWKKKFSCGCTHVEEGAGKPDVIEVQGNFGEELKKLLVEKHGVEEGLISIEVTNKK